VSAALPWLPFVLLLHLTGFFLVAVFVRAHHCSQRDPMRCYSVASEAVSAALVSVAVSVLPSLKLRAIISPIIGHESVACDR